MKGHIYKFTVEYLKDSKGNRVDQEPLVFETYNHDNIFKIVELMQGKAGLQENDSTSLAIGIKLFGEVMLRNKSEPLFKDFMPHFTEFMKKLKQA